MQLILDGLKYLFLFIILFYLLFTLTCLNKIKRFQFFLSNNKNIKTNLFNPLMNYYMYKYTL